MIKKFISNIFFIFFPIIVFEVKGKSMEPTYKEHSKVLARKLWFPRDNVYVGDVVVAKGPISKRLILKRIKEIKNNTYFLIGDNPQESTDSRSFGYISPKDIVARVLFQL